MIPYYDKILIEPFEKKSVIQTDSKPIIEVGKVISVGKDVTFAEPGDIIYFDAYGCSKTAEFQGKEYYIVKDDKAVILGKE